jgi:Inorganic Pyrophosphatase
MVSVAAIVKAHINREASKAHPAPSPAQTEAGNYRKGKVSIHGLDVSIENPRGSARKGIGKDGKPWSVRLPAHYGYIRKTEGSDGDHVDCYLGPHPLSGHVFVVNQREADSQAFDEHKCMIGFRSRDEALAAYKRGFSDGRGEDRIHSVVEMTVPELKEWLKDGDTKNAVVDRETNGSIPGGMAHAQAHASRHGRATGGRANLADGGDPGDWITPTASPSGRETSGHDDWVTSGATTPAPSEASQAPSGWSAAVTDIPREMAASGREAIAATKQAAGETLPSQADIAAEAKTPLWDIRPELRRTLATGRTIASGLATPFAYLLQGPLRSAVGHPMTEAERVMREGAVGLYGEPKVRQAEAATGQQVGGLTYEEARNRVDTALSAAGVRAPIPAGAVPKPPGMIGRLVGPMTEESQRARAADILRQRASDPAAFQAALEQGGGGELVPGSKPTTFQQTGDMGVGSLEREIRTENQAAFQQRRAEQNAARLAQLERFQQTGDPAAVATYLRMGMNDVDRTTEMHLQGVTQRAQAAAEAIGRPNDQEVFGMAIRQELRNAEDAARAESRRLWNAIDPDGTLSVPMAPIAEAHEGIYGTMGPAGRASLSPTEQQIAHVISQYPEDGHFPFGEFTDLRTLVNDGMRNELATNGQSAAYARLSRLRSELAPNPNPDTPSAFDRMIDDASGRWAPGAAQRLQEASAQIKQRHETFGPFKQVLARQGAQGPYLMTDSRVAANIFRPGAEGFDRVRQFRQAVGPEAADDLLRDYAADSLRRTAMRDDGTIDPRGYQRWADRHQDALRAMPAHIAQSFEDAATASDAIGHAAGIREQALANYQKGALGKLIKAEDPEEVTAIVGSILRKGANESVPAMRQLVANTAGDDLARQGLKRAVVDHMMNSFVSNTEAATSEQNLLKSDQFQTFMRKARPALAQLFSPQELDSMAAVAADLKRANRSLVAVKDPAGPSTAQDIAGSKRLGVNLLGRFVWHAASSVAAGLPGLVASEGAMALRDAGIANVQKLVTKAMLEPEFARELLRPTATNRPTPRMMGLLKGASVFGQKYEALRGGASSQSAELARHAEDLMKEPRAATNVAGGTPLQ